MKLSLGDWFLLVVAVEYVIAAGVYWMHGNIGYAIAMAGYTVGNVGLIWASLKLNAQ